MQGKIFAGNCETHTYVNSEENAPKISTAKVIQDHFCN